MQKTRLSIFIIFSLVLLALSSSPSLAGPAFSSILEKPLSLHLLAM